MTDRSITKSPAHVVARYMFWTALAMYVAVTARFVVRYVYVKRVASAAGATRVALVVVPVPECGGCKKDREKAGRAPLQTERLPVEVTNDKVFKRKGSPVFLCSVCDGEALDLALEAHRKRTSRP